MDGLKTALSYNLFPQLNIGLNVITALSIILIFVSIILIIYEKYTPALIIGFIGAIVLYYKNKIF